MKQTKIQLKIMKKSIFLSLAFQSMFVLLFLFSPIYSLATTFQPPSACKITTSWSSTTAKTGSSNKAIATFTNCVGYAPFIQIIGPSSCNPDNSDQIVGLGAKIASSPEQHSADISFCKDGDYSFAAYIQLDDSSTAGRVYSSHLTASANGGSGGGYSVGTRCAYDYECASGFCDVTADTATCQPNPTGGSGGTQSFACVVGGNYLCMSGDIGDCQTTPSCQNSADTCKQIDSSQCGKPVSGGTGTPQNPITGTPQNPITGTPQAPAITDKLYNPLGNDKQALTDLLIVIMKGFLGVIAAWAVAFIVIGGFKMVISQGNEEAVTSGKKTITWAVLGLLVALLSFSIIIIVQNLIGADIKPAAMNEISKLL